MFSTYNKLFDVFGSSKTPPPALPRAHARTFPPRLNNGGDNTYYYYCYYLRHCSRRTGAAVHPVAASHPVEGRDVQHHIGEADGHGHRAVHRVVHPVHRPILRAADDVHHRAVRAHRAPSPALRQAETHHHGAVVQRREEDLVARVPGQLVVKSAQNAR